jgi:hypothetical protein
VGVDDGVGRGRLNEMSHPVPPFRQGRWTGAGGRPRVTRQTHTTSRPGGAQENGLDGMPIPGAAPYTDLALMTKPVEGKPESDRNPCKVQSGGGTPIG